MANRKKADVLSKLATLHSVHTQGLMNEDAVKKGIEGSLADGSLVPLREKDFEKSTPELKEFAAKYGVIKTRNGSGRKGVKPGEKDPNGMEVLVRAQHPQVIPILDAVEKLRKFPMTVTRADGTSIEVAFQPFFRNMSNAKAKKAETVTEGVGSAPIEA
jgi:hypothetical protein